MDEDPGRSVVIPVEPPRGMFPARLDDKGRLKLPVPFQQFFAALPEKKLFVTSLDRRIAQIYPIAIWRENEKFFETYRENPQAAQNVLFNANDLGADAEPDAQGRITVNPDLRRALNLEEVSLRLYATLGPIQLFTEAIYQERLQTATRMAPQDVDLLQRAGLR